MTMDSLTVHYLARELDARWRGRRIRSWLLDRERRVLTISADGSPPVRFDLSSPEVRVHEDSAPAAEGLLGGWTITEVSAPTDDRRLVVRLEKPGKFRGSTTRTAVLQVSVIPTARGALVRDEGGHRMASMGAMLPPPSTPRPMLTTAELERAAERREPDALLHGRWMSPLLARWLVRAGPVRAPELYAALCELPSAEPARCGARRVPFSWCDDAEPVASLIESAPAEMKPRLAEPLGRRARTVARMREELSRAAAAFTLRHAADALLAMGDAPAPAEVVLPDGTRAPVPARAGETALAVAERLYRDVRSMERALETLPGRIADLEREGRDGALGDGAATSSPVPTRARADRPPRSAVPFRTYRSSGGLEIWVGRGAASNDVLTFREAAPNDVWLHARDAAGAHVVLRWTRDEAPPARDLEEAALLAAWHSKMRSSTVVPVDWTRRKHVRKVRGGAPGLVAVQRARTIFVRPSAELERGLRADR